MTDKENFDADAEFQADKQPSESPLETPAEKVREEDSIGEEGKSDKKTDKSSPTQEEAGKKNRERTTPPQKISAIFEKYNLQLKIAGTLFALLTLLWILLPNCTPSAPQNHYLIALDATWTPLRLINKRANMTAFCEQLLYTIAKNKGLQLRITTNGPNLFDLITRKACDGVISILPPNASLANKLVVSQSIYQLGFVVIVPKYSPITSSQEISEKVIGILDSAKILMQIDDYPSAVFVNFENISQLLDALDRGIIEAAVVGNLQAATLLQGLYAGNFKILLPPLLEEGIKLYLLKDEEGDAERFITYFNEGLEELWETGVYNQMITRWDLVNTLQRENTTNQS